MKTPVWLPLSEERVDAVALQHLPGGLQQQPLLRVHGEGFPGRDAEQTGVEVSGAGQETALAGVAGPRAVGIGVVQGVEVPAPVVESRRRVAAVGQQPPEVLGVRTPPAKRQLMPTIAMGSVASDSSSLSRCRVCCKSAVASLRYSRSVSSFAIRCHPVRVSGPGRRHLCFSPIAISRISFATLCGGRSGQQPLRTPAGPVLYLREQRPAGIAPNSELIASVSSGRFQVRATAGLRPPPSRYLPSSPLINAKSSSSDASSKRRRAAARPRGAVPARHQRLEPQGDLGRG